MTVAVVAAAPAPPDTAFPLLSPIVQIRSARSRIVHLRPLREQLLETLAADGVTDSVSIYVEDLNSGVNIGINERSPTHLSSLLKVGVMIAWFKAEEAQPGLLRNKLRLTPGEAALPDDQFARTFDSPLAPNEYEILSLIETMVIRSSNSANAVLCSYITDTRLERVFDDLGVPNAFKVADAQADPYKLGTRLTAKQYSNIIRALYNSAYLDETYSSKALEIMTRSKFDRGIRSILPPGMRAAVKYGVFGGSFYESGIVYLNGDPYLITIFTRGPQRKSYAPQLSWIRKYGGIIHQYMSHLHTGVSP